jgi:hypothetical protein
MQQRKAELKRRDAELKRRDAELKNASVRSEQGYPSPNTPHTPSESSRPQTPTSPTSAARDLVGEIALQHSNQGMRTPGSAKTKPMTRRECQIEKAFHDMLAEIE